MIIIIIPEASYPGMVQFQEPCWQGWKHSVQSLQSSSWGYGGAPSCLQGSEGTQNVARSENQQKQRSISARHQAGSLTQSLYNYNIITQRDIEDAVHLDLIKGLGLLFEGSKSYTCSFSFSGRKKQSNLRWFKRWIVLFFMWEIMGLTTKVCTLEVRGALVCYITWHSDMVLPLSGQMGSIWISQPLQKSSLECTLSMMADQQT